MESTCTLPHMEPLSRVRFAITEDDVIALNTKVMLKSPLRDATYRRNRRTGIIAGLFILVSLGGIAFATAPTHRLGVIRAVVWAVCYAVFWPMYAVRHLTRSAFEHKMIRITERLVRTRKVPFSLGPVEVQLHPDQFRIVDEDGAIGRPWSEATGMMEESDGIYFEFADGSMFRLPSRAFELDSHRSGFLAAAHSLISPDQNPP